MPQKSIIEKVRCPRCNADAAIRVIEMEEYLQLILMCPMCRLRKHQGLTTRKALRLQKQIKKWTELLEKTEKINETYLLSARIKILEEKLRKEQIRI